MTYTIPSYTVQPGSVYQPKSGFPLDFLKTNAVGCWSTRQLLSTGGGNIIRGRDATTNEQDFTAVEYPAGVVTLASGGDAFCPQLYDQSGNGNHATQAVAASQPKLVDTGSLIVDASGRPVMDFDGAGDRFLFSSELILAGDFSVFCTIQFDVATPQQFLYKNSTDRVYIETGLGTMVVYADGVFSNTLFSPALSVGSIYNICLSRLSGVVSLYVDGVVKGALYNAGTLSLLSISSSSFGLNGAIGLMSIFNRALSASEITQIHNALA